MRGSRWSASVQKRLVWKGYVHVVGATYCNIQYLNSPSTSPRTSHDFIK